MDIRNSWAVVLIAVLFAVCGCADRAKDAFEKGVSAYQKGDYTESIRLDPKCEVTYCDRGAVYEKKGEFDKAIADETEAIRLDPKDPLAYINRGAAYGKKGDKVKAKEDFAQAKTLGYKEK